jgi:hypothetical protein
MESTRKQLQVKFGTLRDHGHIYKFYFSHYFL